MKTIIAGSRDLKWVDVEKAMDECPWSDEISEVVSGCARGVDRLGEIWAANNELPTKLFPADWRIEGKRAGFIRNTRMAKYASALVAVWDGESRGTKNMIGQAQAWGLRVFIWTPKMSE